MPDQLDQFVRETIAKMLGKLSPAERMEGLSVDDLLAALSPEEREALRRRLKDNDHPPESA